MHLATITEASERNFSAAICQLSRFYEGKTQHYKVKYSNRFSNLNFQTVDLGRQRAIIVVDMNDSHAGPRADVYYSANRLLYGRHLMNTLLDIYYFNIGESYRYNWPNWLLCMRQLFISGRGRLVHSVQVGRL